MALRLSVCPVVGVLSPSLHGGKAIESINGHPSGYLQHSKRNYAKAAFSAHSNQESLQELEHVPVQKNSLTFLRYSSINSLWVNH